MRFFLFALLVSMASCKSISQTPVLEYPNIKKEPVTELIHGISTTDDYRNIEQTKDSTVLNWFNGQTELANSYLDSLPQFFTVYDKMKDLRTRTKTWATDLFQDENGVLYYMRTRPDKSDKKPYVLHKRDTTTFEEVELFDPGSYKPESGNKYSIDFLKPSWDGKFIAVALKHSSNFDTEIIVINTETMEPTGDHITNAHPYGFGGIQWLPDSSGFAYMHFPVTEKGQEGYKANTTTLVHILGQDNDKKNYFFGKENGLDIDPTLFPMVQINSSKDKYIIGFVSGVSKYHKTYYANLEELVDGIPQWKLFYDEDQMVYNDYGYFKGDTFYFMTAMDAPNFKISYLDMNDINFDEAKVLVPEKSNEVISNFKLVKEGLYYTTFENGVKGSLYYKNQDNITKVDFPFSTGDFKLISPNIYDNEMFVETDGWANDLTRFKIRNGKILEQIIVAEIPKFPELKNVIAEEILVKGHDGEMIPVSLIYDKSKIIKNRPLVLESYGAYGTTETPSFNPRMLTWIALGGIRAVAHIRGGGEKGKYWHDSGKKKTKSNSWKDVISVAEYLIDKEFTSKSKILLYSSSAGSVSQGMAVANRPDLFAVFAAQVPLLNPARLSAGSYKHSNYQEFGDIDDPKESKYLLELDPYLNLPPKTSYPATIIVPSDKDDRLDLWESGKFIAKMQEYNTSDKPILLDVHLSAGHRTSSTKKLSRIFGFALHQMSLE